MSTVQQYTPADIDTLAIRAMYAMRTFIGQGETTANNRGPFIHWELEGHKLSQPAPAWCALTCRQAYKVAYLSIPEYKWLAQPLPRWLFRSGSVPEPGALRLVAGMAREGRRFKDVAQAQPGDLVLWKRTGGHHLGMVEFVHLDVVHTIEGNVGRYPAKVRRLTHDVDQEPHFVTFASLRKEQ